MKSKIVLFMAKERLQNQTELRILYKITESC